MTENTNNKSESALREERILEFWKENKIFEKSLERSSPKGEFVFYEGPPTANGKPGIHHLEARAFKDVIPRYKTMQGYHVRRKGGWDTHGLPVELQVEKKLGLDSKKAIEDYGIDKFNQECKESVWEYLDIWNKFTKRIGFWVDQENPYVTYHNSYIESVWNILKKVDEKKLLYKDYKVVPWCPRCGTALSSHELAQGYEDVKDLSVYVKFKVRVSPKYALRHSHSVLEGQDPSGRSEDSSEHVPASTYILAWTTTPWTLPGNVALAVGEDIDYVKIEKDNEFLILAKDRLSVIDGEYKIISEFKGKDLVDLEYEPLYPFLKNTKVENLANAYKVYKASFVTTEDGTGVVHTAVMYGQDDFELGNELNLPKHHLVGLNGRFYPEMGFLSGRFVRDEEVAVDIIKDLAHRGLLLKKEKYEHSYPHCWRCKTALIYYARDSWYIKMSDPEIKKKLIKENEDINWEPAHIKEGRFGEWLRDIKDWAISRERYWGTPLPAWTCEKCGKTEVIGSVDEIKKKTKKSGNSYFMIRHGEAENNIEDIFKFSSQNDAELTDFGRKGVEKFAKELKERIDLIISSPLIRTKQTTEIICKQIDFPLEKVVYDKRIQEWEVSDEFEGKSKEEVAEYYEGDYIYTPYKKFSNGESYAELLKRVGSFIYEIESKYKDKNILIVSHGGAIAALQFITNHYSFVDLKIKGAIKEFKNTEMKKFDFIPLPHNEDYELDLHKPYIDEIPLLCECGGELKRTKEVMDVWFDSGAMPFAQDHYPFENKKWIEGKGYPADFISEAIDQTRGWFYTLHAIGILMGRGKAYKNVICLGHLMDAKGKKMSKSLGNIIDPWEMIEKYGVDVLRLWMYAVNQPGESKNFDEKTVLELQRQVFGLLYNVLAFYELYRDKDLEQEVSSSQNILDKWILERFNELVKLTSVSLDNYKILEPARALRDFVSDLSTWYLRRSRERIKEGDKEAKQTLYFILKNLAKVMAPFVPLSAEDIWQKLKNENDEESVHLTKWPEPKKGFTFAGFFGKQNLEKIIKDMQEVREIVSKGLEQRQKAGIKVRQPLNSLKISHVLDSEYLILIKDELNVKEIKTGSLDGEVVLDTEITPGLKEEGVYRELVRAVQDLRKKLSLTPKDLVSLSVETDEGGKKLLQKFEIDFLKVVSASDLRFTENNAEEIKIDNLSFKIKIEK